MTWFKVDDYPTEQCRTCQAPIIWTLTAARGQPMPVDAEPAAGGNLALDFHREGSTTVISRVIPQHLAFGRHDLRLSHFVQCPQANKWRRR